MLEHNWRRDYFSFGEWDGYKTCLQTYKCIRCKKEITIPESEELIENSPCIKLKRPKTKPLVEKFNKKKKKRRRQ